MAFGIELIRNGKFVDNLNNWTAPVFSWSWVSGRAFLFDPSNTETIGQDLTPVATLKVGTVYRIEFDWEIVNGVIGNEFYAGFDQTGYTTVLTSNGTQTGHFSQDIVTVQGDVDINTFRVEPDFTFQMYIDNVSIRENLGSYSLQTAHLSGATIAGDIQTLNTGKDDDSTPIYYELETQELEFGNRLMNKRISDKLVVFSENANDSKIQIQEDEKDFKTIDIDLGKRVANKTLPAIDAHFLKLKWSGNSIEKSPILEGFYFNKIEDKGIL